MSKVLILIYYVIILSRTILGTIFIVYNSAFNFETITYKIGFYILVAWVGVWSSPFYILARLIYIVFFCFLIYASVNNRLQIKNKLLFYTVTAIESFSVFCAYLFATSNFFYDFQL